MSEPMTANLWCKITGNPCGTDTWSIEFPCRCQNCVAYIDIATRMRQIRAAAEALPHAEDCRRNEPDACASCGGMRELHRDMVTFAHPHEFVEPPCGCPHGDILGWTEEWK